MIQLFSTNNSVEMINFDDMVTLAENLKPKKHIIKGYFDNDKVISDNETGDEVKIFLIQSSGGKEVGLEYDSYTYFPNQDKEEITLINDDCQITITNDMMNHSIVGNIESLAKRKAS